MSNKSWDSSRGWGERREEWGGVLRRKPLWLTTMGTQGLRNVDICGVHGSALGGQWGYQGGKKGREGKAERISHRLAGKDRNLRADSTKEIMALCRQMGTQSKCEYLNKNSMVLGT